jgi:hypothetical protein
MAKGATGTFQVKLSEEMSKVIKESLAKFEHQLLYGSGSMMATPPQGVLNVGSGDSLKLLRQHHHDLSIGYHAHSLPAMESEPTGVAGPYTTAHYHVAPMVNHNGQVHWGSLVRDEAREARLEKARHRRRERTRAAREAKTEVASHQGPRRAISLGGVK